MEKNKALKMIDDYLSEPNSIHHDWIDCLLYCRECIKKLDEFKEENELLRNIVDNKRKDKGREIAEMIIAEGIADRSELRGSLFYQELEKITKERNKQ